jgi:FkbM family methyltransferase
MISAKRIMRDLLERVLAYHDYALKDALQPPRGLGPTAKLLRERGFRPASVIDVGVGNGTPWLYETFPEARFELFEPLDVFEPAMNRICSSYNAQYHVTALGSQSGLATIDVHVNAPTSSTMAGFSPELLLAAVNPITSIDQKVIKVSRLDDFGPFEGPVLLKLDVEGYEADVLRGAPSTLAATEVIIAEVTVLKRHMKAMSFGQFMSYLESLGFALVDFAALTPIRRDGPLSYVDAVFVRADSELRR